MTPRARWALLAALACGPEPARHAPGVDAPGVDAPGVDAPGVDAPAGVASPAVAHAAAVVPVGPHPAPPPSLSSVALDAYSLRELVVLRNSVYAAAGQPFVKDWLRAHFEAQPGYVAQAARDPTAVTRSGLALARAVADHVAGLRRAELVARRRAVARRLDAGDARPEDAVELQLLARSLGEDVRRWPEVAALPSGAQAWLLGAADTALDDLARLDQPLVAADVSGLSARDLRVLRATVEARRGRAFGGALGQHFARLPWAQPDPAFARDRLTDADWDNLGRLDAWAAALDSSPSDGQAGDQWGPEAGWFYGS